MASTHTDRLAVRQSIEVPVNRSGEDRSRNPPWMTIDLPPDSGVNMNMAFADAIEAGEPPTQDNCDANHNNEFDPIITISSTSKVAGQTVAPFLAKHIPDQYTLLPKTQPAATSQKDPNTKYCYRHRPDSKCRRTADEPTMENLQNVRRYESNVHLCRTDGMAGPPSFIPSGPARHFSRLGSLFRCARKAEKPYAPRHSHAMLLSSTLLSLYRRQRPHPNRLSRRPPLRSLFQNIMLSGHNLALQGSPSQSEVAPIGR